MKPTKQAHPMTVKNMLRAAPLATALAAALCMLQAQAQGNSAALAPSFQTSDPCRAAVSKFEQSIGFIRQSQGNQAAAELKEKLLPAKLENAILFKDGYCGLAAYLREKKLDK
jgi:hypothetical protein